MKTVCAWCGLLMRDGPEPTTHGMCPACYQREMDELNSLIGEAGELKALVALKNDSEDYD